MTTKKETKPKKKWNFNRKFNKEVIILTEAYIKEAETDKFKLPKLESLALKLGVVKKTLYNWLKDHPKYQNYLDLILAMQLERLIDDGIYAKTNAPVIKMMLMKNHGFKEEIANSGEVKSVFDDDQLTRIANRIANRSNGDGSPTGKK